MFAFARRCFRPQWDKKAFLSQLPKAAKVLDVGCGNGSPSFFKSIRTDIYYVGLDVDDYAQTSKTISSADEYIIVSGSRFHEEIVCRGVGVFDAVVSAHNIEHCLSPDLVLSALTKTLRRGGQLYLSFPCEESVNFPSRQGTLNFRDDPTHREVPDWARTLKTLKDAGMVIEFSAKRYRPFFNALIGALYEPAGAAAKTLAPYNGTWALYGFESVIWARMPE
jgi:2-polyprenyl-3-methyl-5-hydroxy-6-metoxy-1,4-benzoquinol methylase